MLAERVKEWPEQGKREGLEAGRKEGLRQGRAELLLRVLDRRFGPVPANLQARVQGASLDTLARWGERAFEADRLGAVFEETG